MEGRILIEVQEMRGQPLVHSGFEKYCRVNVMKHTQNTKHPSHHEDDIALHERDSHGHTVHKYDFASILNFHFEVEQRNYKGVEASLEVVHKSRIHGEKVCGHLEIPIQSLKHGVYDAEWHDVFSGKGSKKVKVGQIFLKLLLHKEGLSKEQRRASISMNIQDLHGNKPTGMLASPGDKTADSGAAAIAKRPWRKKAVPKDTGGSTAEGSTVSTASTNITQLREGESSGAIEAEVRLGELERSMAEVLRMMKDVSEAVTRLQVDRS